VNILSTGFLAALGMAVLFVLAPAQSRAQVPDAIFDELVLGKSSVAPGTVTETTTTASGSETSTATTSANLSASTSVLQTGTVYSTLDSLGKSIVQYYVDVVSPDGASPGAAVPMTISANITNSASGYNATADGSIVMEYEGTNQFIGSIGASTSCSISACSSQSGVLGVLGTQGTLNLVNAPYSVFADSTYFIEMVSESSTDYEGGTASDTVDPFIAIDPTWLAENPGYTLEISSNVTQTSPVPLPATAYLLLSGLGGLALMGRRRIIASAPRTEMN
jgi:hypothetical protein